VRFFLDNNLSTAIALALNSLSKNDGCSVAHLSDHFARNTKDEDWLRKLSLEGDWVIVSGDLRIMKSPHLQRVWEESRLTTFFLAKGWMNKPFWEQAWWLVRWWPDLVKQAQMVDPGYAWEVPAKSSGKLKLVSSPKPKPRP
jgi:hypothetical protein